MVATTCPFFPDFPEQDQQAPLTLAFQTDTRTPQSVVPVFLIHTLAQPFCSQPSCVCHQNPVAVTALLAAIDQGALVLEEIGDTSKGKQR